MNFLLFLIKKQHYLNFLKPNYNNLKYAKSRLRFIHSKLTLERLKSYLLGRLVTKVTKLKILAKNFKAHYVDKKFFFIY